MLLEKINNSEMENQAINPDKKNNEEINHDAEKIYEYIKEKFATDKVGEGIKEDIIYHLIDRLLCAVGKDKIEEELNLLLKNIEKSHANLIKIKTSKLLRDKKFE